MSDNALVWGASTSADDRLWATAAHLSLFLFLPLIGPFIIYMLSANKPYVRYHSAQAIAIHIVTLVLGAMGMLVCGIGWLMGLVPLYGAFLAFSGSWSGYPLLRGIGR
jgi:uncharacterized Tic20 family protein